MPRDIKRVPLRATFTIAPAQLGWIILPPACRKRDKKRFAKRFTSVLRKGWNVADRRWKAKLPFYRPFRRMALGAFKFLYRSFLFSFSSFFFWFYSRYVPRFRELEWSWKIITKDRVIAVMIRNTASDVLILISTRYVRSDVFLQRSVVGFRERVSTDKRTSTSLFSSPIVVILVKKVRKASSLLARPRRLSNTVMLPGPLRDPSRFSGARNNATTRHHEGHHGIQLTKHRFHDVSWSAGLDDLPRLHEQPRVCSTSVRVPTCTSAADILRMARRKPTKGYLATIREIGAIASGGFIFLKW